MDKTALPSASPVLGTPTPTVERTEIMLRKYSSPTSVKTSTPRIEQATVTRTSPVKKSPTPPPSATPRSTSTPDPEDWQNFPVVPQISDAVLEIYQRGLKLGNNPQAFSKIGDCGSTPAWFLGDFDRGPDFYRLGEYEFLEEVIQKFQGSYSRTSLAARSGFNTSALFTPLWSDREFCEANEAPLPCEYRTHKPIIAFIMLGTNDVWQPSEFEPQMRKIIQVSLDSGVIPILATKADNQEGDGSINATMAKLSLEYQIPLWNYWRAVDPLPDHGLQEDQAHLTWGRNFFDDPETMLKAWPVRNLTALLVLDSIWKKLNNS